MLSIFLGEKTFMFLSLSRDSFLEPCLEGGMLSILPMTLWISFPGSERYWTKTRMGPSQQPTKCIPLQYSYKFDGVKLY